MEGGCTRAMHRLTFLTFNGRLPWTFLPLVLVLLAGLSLRLYGVDWDSGYGFHPDERDIYMRSGCMFDLLTEAPGHQECGYLVDHPEAEPGVPGLGTFLDPERSPLNPHWFPLGSILIYVLVLIRSIIELFADINALDMRFVGRVLSALADVGSIFLVYVLGRRMYGPGVGILAAAFTALAVIHIQHSHFYRPETFSVLFTLASFWAMLRMVERERLRDSALLGLLVGLALAPKINILPLALPLALAYGYRVLDSVGGRWSHITAEVVGRVLGHAALAAAVAAAVFFVSSPYAFLDFGAFVSDLSAQANMANHAGLWPFTIQYIDTPPFIYQIRQTILWGLGLPLGVVVWVGVVFTAGMVICRRRTFRADLLVLAWVAPSLLLLESFEVRFLRYVFPLMPFMVLMGSRMLVWMVEKARAEVSQYSSPGNEVLPPAPRPPEALPAPQQKEGVPGDARISRLTVSIGSLWSLRGALDWGPMAAMAGNPRLRRSLALASVGLMVFVVAATAFYALAFERVYARDHPAVEASRWINDNVPAGTSIVSDNHWDEYIPNLYSYDVWQFPAYEADTFDKMITLGSRLSGADFLVFYSNRPYTSVARDPERFPLSSAYYRLLFEGQLGYRLDRAFTSYPGLAGVEFRDEPLGRAGLPVPAPLAPGQPAPVSFNLGYADDNVVGYDHPRVLLFRNVERLSEKDLWERLISAPLSEPRVSAAALMLSDEDRRIQQEGGTWSQIFNREGWTNGLPVLAWLLVVELIYLAALPLAMFLFRPLPDRGIILARILGLLGVSYVAWLLVSLGWTDFSRTPVVLGILAAGGLSGGVLLIQWREIKSFLKQHWKLLLIGEVLFLTAFLAFVSLRAANPDLWHPAFGGEKPMELAYFNAVIRSASLPPFDPWFSGGYLNYYYYGYFILGGLSHLTGILPTTAFNLAVPLFFALTVTGAYTLVYNMAEGVRSGLARNNESAGDDVNSNGNGDESNFASGPPQLDDGENTEPDPGGGTAPALAPEGVPSAAAAVATGDGRWRRIMWSPVSAGLLAGLFTAVIGNLDGIVQVIQNIWRKAVEGQGFLPFSYWRSSRMLGPQENFDPSPVVFWLQDKVAGFEEVSPHITEFPFFSFLFADLHAHVMVIPFTLLVIGLGLSLVVGLRRNNLWWSIACYLALALALGSLWVINSWDYPTYLLLTLALLALALFLRPGPAHPRLILFVSMATGMAALSLLAFLPFHQSYEVFNSGLVPSKWRTPVELFLGIHGLFLFIIATFLVYSARTTLLAVVRGAFPRFAPDHGSTLSSYSLSRLRGLLGLGLVATILLAVTGYWTAVVLLVYLMLTLTLAFQVLASRGANRPFESVPLVLLATGLSVAIGVDFVRVQEDIGRMNTLFKYYLEVWVLLSVASAYMLWRLGKNGSLRGRLKWVKGLWVGVLLFLIGSSLIYTALGSRARIDQRFNDLPVTLDGSAYMSQAVHFENSQPFELKWDLEAIGWLQDNVRGSPVVLEAHTDQYRWGARIASYTGLPTVLGWPWHQIQQRMAYRSEVLNRVERVREMYNTTDLIRTEELLQQYDVKYIVVGDLERILYTPSSLQKFSDLAEIGRIQLVFQNEGVSIYRVE